MGYQRSSSGGRGRSGGGRSGGRGRDGSDDGPRRNKRRFARKRVCEFCVGKDKVIDYKKADELKRYVSEYGRLRPRRQTGACAKHQRAVAVAVKRARHIALLPFVVE